MLQGEAWEEPTQELGKKAGAGGRGGFALGSLQPHDKAEGLDQKPEAFLLVHLLKLYKQVVVAEFPYYFQFLLDERTAPAHILLSSIYSPFISLP